MSDKIISQYFLYWVANFNKTGVNTKGVISQKKWKSECQDMVPF